MELSSFLEGCIWHFSFSIQKNRSVWIHLDTHHNTYLCPIIFCLKPKLDKANCFAPSGPFSWLWWLLFDAIVKVGDKKIWENPINYLIFVQCHRGAISRLEAQQFYLRIACLLNFCSGLKSPFKTDINGHHFFFSTIISLKIKVKVKLLWSNVIKVGESVGRELI